MPATMVLYSTNRYPLSFPFPERNGAQRRVLRVGADWDWDWTWVRAWSSFRAELWRDPAGWVVVGGMGGGGGGGGETLKK